jgi:hypothetical protein
MHLYTFAAGDSFYQRMGMVTAASHRAFNPNLGVTYLSSDPLNADLKPIAESYSVTVHDRLAPQRDLSPLAIDGNTARLFTFLRWQLYLEVTHEVSDDEIHVVSDPDILSLGPWRDAVLGLMRPHSVAVKRQTNYDNMVNGGFVVGTKSDLHTIGTLLVDRALYDARRGALVRSPYDQIYWFRYIPALNLREELLPESMMQFAVERERAIGCALVHQIDFKGYLFSYPIARQICDKAQLRISHDELSRY